MRAWKPGFRGLLPRDCPSSSLPVFVHGSLCSKTISHLMVILTFTNEKALLSLIPVVHTNGEKIKEL